MAVISPQPQPGYQAAGGYLAPGPPGVNRGLFPLPAQPVALAPQFLFYGDINLAGREFQGAMG
ncbi:hypothetical protein [Moorella sulfitireducens (nom. illeg.)]|uniref:hypothetical protein n=1 Tax=Neomoorella sulfitireducens TaxID=2972948 RepID=UPI0021AC7499|nr:hypothetical protein [Moorella sulfitireducens]